MRTLKLLPLVLLSSITLAQDSVQSQSSDLTIRRYTKLVQVPVIVTDHKGNPVRGLTKDDFVLTENKKQRSIATFEEVSAPPVIPGQPDTSSARLQKLTYSNMEPGMATGKSILIIVLDAMNTPFMNQRQGREAMIKFLSDKIKSHHIVSLFIMTPRGIKPIHLYTTDTRVLIKALKQVAQGEAGIMDTSGGMVPGSEVGINQQTVSATASGMRTFIDDISSDAGFTGLRQSAYAGVMLNAFQQLANYYVDIPGRKSLIWTSGFFPSYFYDTTSISSTDFGGRYLRTMEMLTDANIALYPIDAYGLLEWTPPSFATPQNPSARNPGGIGGGDRQIVSGGDTALGHLGNSVSRVDSMKTIAELTGGRAFYGTNDFAGAMEKAVQDSEDFYLLGYYLPPDVKPGRYELKVKTNKPGLKVRSRSRMFVSAEGRDAKRELDLAKRASLQFTNLPIQVKFDENFKREASEIPFQISIDGKEIELSDPENGLNLNVVVIVRKPDGTQIEAIDQTLTGKVKDTTEFRNQPFVYTNKLKAVGDDAVLRFVVRDNASGKIGSVIVERHL